MSSAETRRTQLRIKKKKKDIWVPKIKKGRFTKALFNDSKEKGEIMSTGERNG